MQVDPRTSGNTAAMVERAQKLAQGYRDIGIGWPSLLVPSPATCMLHAHMMHSACRPDKVLMRLPASWEGIQAAKQLESEGIPTHLILVYRQAHIACAWAAGCSLPRADSGVAMAALCRLWQRLRLASASFSPTLAGSQTGACVLGQSAQAIACHTSSHRSGHRYRRNPGAIRDPRVSAHTPACKPVDPQSLLVTGPCCLLPPGLYHKHALQGPREDSGFSSGSNPGVALVKRISDFCRTHAPKTKCMVSGIREKEGKPCPDSVVDVLCPEQQHLRTACTSGHAAICNCADAGMQVLRPATECCKWPDGSMLCAEALQLAGVDYLVLGNSVLSSLSDTATMAGGQLIWLSHLCSTMSMQHPGHAVQPAVGAAGQER